MNNKCCIFFATADWDEPYWTNKQHTANSFVSLGWRVLYVESIGLRYPNLRSKKDLKRIVKRLIRGTSSFIFGAKKYSNELSVLTPLQIPGGHYSKWLQIINKLLLKICIYRHVKLNSWVTPLIWTYHPFIFSSLDGVNCGQIVYHCVDDLSEFPGVNKQVIRAAEIMLLKACTIVFATNLNLVEKCRESNKNTHFFPNVVDIEHFQVAEESKLKVPSDLEAIPQPRLVYHGVLSDFKIDFQLILDIAIKKPEWSIIFIGAEREGQRSDLIKKMGSLKNIYFLGYKKYSELPSYLNNVQIGLLPSLLNNYTRSMFPMKYFEYIAAGLRVVSTRIDFSKTHNAGLIAADNVADFISAIEHQLAKPPLSSQESVDIISDNTWIKRTNAMLGML